MDRTLAVERMEALSEVQLIALRDLKVSERQEILGKSFLESIADWEHAPKADALGLCFLMDACPVGMVLFQKQTPPEARRISVHGLKIARPWQKKGYGHQAFTLAVDYLKAEWPDAKRLSLAVDAENRPAVAVYRKFGMSDSGPIFDGPNGIEHHMDFLLKP